MSGEKNIPDFVVGIGASAGGLKAFEALLPSLPEGKNTAYILLQHQDASHESELEEILAEFSPFPIRLVNEDIVIEGNTLYLCPSGTQCVVSGDHFLLKTRYQPGPRHTVDMLFASLAQHFPERCAGIILSGTGKDGVMGLQEIKAAGGWALVQDPDTAEYSGMPQSALNLFLADFVRSPETMGKELEDIIRLSGKQPEQGIVSDREKLHMLLEVMENDTGFNFRRYKEPMLLRRIQRRMVANKISTLGEYLLLVKKKPEEADLLIKDIFITVTGFFRDRKVFKRLERLLKEMLKDVSGKRALRIWSVGCATGEEAYTIALLLAELTSGMSRAPDVRIFATDIDEDNINFARKGIYSAKAVENIPKDLLRRYFDRTDDAYQVNAELRDMVVFARHDATVDTAFSKMDLILCRNLLIYFNRQAQTRLLNRFHYSLRPGGYLLLGSSESIGSSEELFEALDRQHKFYRNREIKNLAVVNAQDHQVRAAPGDNVARVVPWQQHMWALYFDEYAPAAVLVNSRLELIHVHGKVQPYLSLPEGDFNFSLLQMARPELKTDMQMVLQQALRSGSSVRSRAIKLEEGDGKQDPLRDMVSMVAIPRHAGDGDENNRDELLLIFEERSSLQSAHHEQPGEGDDAQEEHIRALEEELAVTRDQLQANIEALEAANQELQSINEEFQSTMEELQSSNEEFQTTNEELESANEELITVNEEISAKSRDLSHINLELDTILNATLAGIIVVDSNLHVTRYSDSCRKLFSLWPDKVDNISQLMTRLDGLTAISPLLERGFRSRESSQLELRIERRFFVIRLIPVMEEAENFTKSLIIAFYDETEMMEKQKESELLAAIVRGSDDAIIVQDLKGRIRNWNDGAQQMFGYGEKEALKLNIRDLIAKGDKGHYSGYVNDLVHGGELHGLETRGQTKSGDTLDIWSSASVLKDYTGEIDSIAVIFRDISEKNAIEGKLNAVVESTPDPFVIVEADGIIQRINRQAELLFGYTRKELIGQSFKVLVPERFRKQHDIYTKNYQNKPVMRQMGAGLALWCLHKNGEEIPVDISLSPVIVGDETTVMVRFRDVRKEKEEETMLREARLKADEANRTKTRFLAAASHDLRQPLQSISMYLGALAGKVGEEEKVRVIEQARMALDTTNNLLNALLNISKLESGKVQPEIESFKIGSLLKRVYNTEAPQAEEKGQEFSMIPSSVNVTSDPALLEQLVTNLVANAVKYSPPHSHIVLGCRRLGARLRIQVADNGPGIKSTELDAIFDEYRQLEYDGHYIGKGLGLGLSIVKLIAELLNLKLEVSSIPGRGSSFSVEVPVAKTRAVKKQQKKAAAHRKKTPRTGIVLLIEDDSAVLDSTTLFLELSGFTVVSAVNSGQAMDVVNGNKPDVIISDYGLSQGENGIELVQRIRKKLKKKVPAVIVTGDTSENRIRDAKAAGCEIIAKPIEAETLLSAVETLLSNN